MFVLNCCQENAFIWIIFLYRSSSLVLIRYWSSFNFTNIFTQTLKHAFSCHGAKLVAENSELEWWINNGLQDTEHGVSKKTQELWK